MNDYKPGTLTSVVTKTLEGLVLVYLKSITDSLLDPVQLCLGQTGLHSMALHFILQHVESPAT